MLMITGYKRFVGYAERYTAQKLSIHRKQARLLMKDKSEGFKVIADNRQARFLYEILETYEAGIQLTGTEVKSIRAGKVNLQDGYALVRNGEVWLINVHISPYTQSSEYFNHEPRRTRKLLLHRKEIRTLVGKVEQQGLTLVPLKMYLKRGLVKVSFALGKGKKLHDKREDMKRKDDQREMQRAMKRY
ncbi:SsrA-binding protein [Dulcicalothrix desertica PCC 7102]|uniref:SsrA-binding protein n=2 Tax=Dulcicalothrix desertica TaxID=32056 RepID=A0A3S1CET7_9CYAN|nr:SsrA-binding protein [Dulcicalothrix desertica PCC 7102]